ncbi:MAG: gliding motility protein GldM [Bacteroidota bacterium]|jgi:gliding motility-associated protein GldM
MSMPKEPRQKMINIMYLVLTALLALNVSSEIINAFKTINNSLLTSNGIVENKNVLIFKSLQEKLDKAETHQMAAIWKPKADQVKSAADQAYNYIETLKNELIFESSQKGTMKDENGNPTFKADDLDAATRLLVEGPKKAEELKSKLESFRSTALGVDPEVKTTFENTLPLDLSMPKVTGSKAGVTDWGYAYFHMTPTIAALTILSKFQNDIKNSESQIVEFCHKKVGEVQVRYDAFQAIASQSSEYLMPGQELRITGGVGAFSSAAKPNVTIDGASIALNTEGVAEYKTTVGGPGSYSKKVSISFKKPDGTVGTLDKEIKYTVGSPTGASVSADAVKVLYIGLKNPLTINGGTAGAEKTSASITQGKLDNQGGGKFIAEVTTPGEATIGVTADGKKTDFKFKVKRVPNPTAMIGSSEGGREPANKIKAQQGVRAELKDFVFEGVEFNVVSFTLIANGGSFTNLQFAPNVGAAFNADCKRILDKCSPGTSLIIDEIKAVGPGGDTRKLPPIVFNLY